MIDSIVDSFVSLFEKQMDKAFYNVKKKVFRVVLQAVLLGCAAVSVIVGAILLAGRYFPVEYALILIGLIVFNVILLSLRKSH